MRTDSLHTVLTMALLGAAALAPAEAQITLFDQAAIAVTLNGREPSPAIGTTSSGDCTGRLVPASGQLNLACSSDVGNAGDVIVTRGRPGASATELVTLGSGNVVGAAITLAPAEVALLLTGQLYV